MILRYLKIIFIVYRARLGKDLSLPLFNQIMQNIGSLCFFFIHLLAFKLIIDKFSFPGWSIPEMWILLFTFEIFTYSCFFLFWNGLNKTVKDINSGAFDLIVSKPVSSKLVTFFRGGGSHNLIAVILGMVFLALTVFIYRINVSPLSVTLYIVTFILSLWTAYCIAVSFISLNFKFGRLDATAGAIFQFQEVYKYPSTIYLESKSFYWFAVVSLSLLTTLPAASLLLKPIKPLFLYVFVATAVAVTFISNLTWNWGLRRYSSSGS
jgi:ABC-type uncharacterized transport system permease subunit